MGRRLVETADLTLNRRTLLAAAAGGAAMAMGCGPGSAPADSAAAAVNGWTPPNDEERRALVATARFGPKQAVRGANGIAICTHPLASAAAADMLALGGNACDGVMAASIAQAVVEPHMTTLSGCLSMLYYDAASGEYSYVNGMMAAPRAVPDVKNMELAEFGALMAKTDGVLCFVPGFWGGFEAGHDRHGRLPRSTVMAPAIHYARHGFEIHPFLWGRDVRRIVGAGPGALQPRDLLQRQHAPRHRRPAGAERSRRHPRAARRRGQRPLLPGRVRPPVRRNGPGQRRPDHRRGHGGLRGVMGRAGPWNLPRLRRRGFAGAGLRRPGSRGDHEHGRTARPPADGAGVRVRGRRP